MIKVSVVLLVGLLFAALLRRQSAALRHFVLASTIACAAAMPIVQVIAPVWPIAIPAFLTSYQSGGSVAGAAVSSAWLVDGSPAEPQSNAVRSQRAVLTSLERIWLAGVVASLALLLMGFGRLAWVTSRSRQVVDGAWCDEVAVLAARRARRTSVRLLQTDHPTLLVTWGFTRPKIILPMTAREWPAERVRAVLGHELAHVRRRDWAVQMLAEFVKCIYWFNPLIWIACLRLRQESEKACDDAVLSIGMHAPEYATHLLDVARAFRHTHTRRSVFPAPAMARPSHLERRVRVMLNSGLSHAPLGRLAGVAVVVALVGVTVSIAGVVAATDAPQSALSQPSVAPNAGSVAGGQTVSTPRIAVVTSTPRIAVVTMEDGKKVGVRLPATSGSTVADPAPTAPAANELAAPPAPPLVSAQTASAACSGTLTDTTGRAMAGVTIALANNATANKLEAQTDEAGQFSINDLPAGEYLMEMRKPGFLTYRARFLLMAGQHLRRGIVAQIGSLAETVVVQGGGASTVAATPATPRPVTIQLRKTGTSDADPCSQSTTGGCITPPMKLVDAKPMFPAAHATDGASGTVVIEGLVGTDGYLKNMRAKNGADPAFAESALEAVQRWQFAPVRLNGIPQECRIEVTVKFVSGGV